MGRQEGVHQRWFCGAHADVGGGYLTQDSVGLRARLDDRPPQGRRGGDLAAYQAAKRGNFGPVHTPHKDPPFALLPHGPRKIPQDALFHPSVQVYLDGFAAYQPQGLAALLQGAG